MKSYREIEREYLERVNVGDDTEERIRGIVASLPRRERKIIILYAEFRSLQQVAKRLKVPKSTLQYRLEKIRQKIINQLQITNSL